MRYDADMNMGIDEPRGYCPRCRRTGYHADGCPELKGRPAGFRPPPRQHRGLTGMQLLLLVLSAIVVAAVVVAVTR